MAGEALSIREVPKGLHLSSLGVQTEAAESWAQSGFLAASLQREGTLPPIREREKK